MAPVSLSRRSRRTDGAEPEEEKADREMADADIAAAGRGPPCDAERGRPVAVDGLVPDSVAMWVERGVYAG